MKKNEVERVVPDLFLFFKKALDEVEPSGLQLSLIYLDSTPLGVQ